MEVLLAAESIAKDFFERRNQKEKKKYTGRGRLNALMLWSCGYSSWPHREQWHVVCGARDAQPWPEQLPAAAAASPEQDTLPVQGAGDKSTMSLREALLNAEALLRRVAMCTLAAAASSAAAAADGDGDVGLAPAADVGPLVGAAAAAEDDTTTYSTCQRLLEACEQMGHGTDPSVLDAFHYLPSEGDAAAGGCVGGSRTAEDEKEEAMAPHYDPGVLSLTRPSDVPGLQICSSATNHWIAIEELARPNEVIVFAGEQLEEASGGRVKAARHRVMRDGRPRESVVFELRAPGSVRKMHAREYLNMIEIECHFQRVVCGSSPGWRSPASSSRISSFGRLRSITGASRAAGEREREHACVDIKRFRHSVIFRISTCAAPRQPHSPRAPKYPPS